MMTVEETRAAMEAAGLDYDLAIREVVEAFDNAILHGMNTKGN